ncbi:MAG TPA: hypothetical protein VLE89_05065 [Chlamydiales bacterium]|nr:hypothetical protein [Chlamydiales bacterium]
MLISNITPHSYYHSNAEALSQQVNEIDWIVPSADGSGELSQETRHLILHFDINRTLIACDQVQQKSARDVIINTLADQTEDLWDSQLTHPISYSHYVKYHLFPNPTLSKEIKNKQKEEICRFLDVMQEQDHPLYPALQRKFDHALSKLNQQEGMIFPSFYKLLDYLNERGISYTLVFRTFGADAPEIAAELNGHFGEGFLTDIRPAQEKETLYDFLKTTDHHVAIRDDWDTWYAHNEESNYGKPFPIDFEDSKRLSLFFDDGARLNKERPERNGIAPYDVHRGVLSLEELIAKNLLFPVDTLKALADENYFIDLIEKALTSGE